MTLAGKLGEILLGLVQGTELWLYVIEGVCAQNTVTAFPPLEHLYRLPAEATQRRAASLEVIRYEPRAQGGVMEGGTHVGLQSDRTR